MSHRTHINRVVFFAIPCFVVISPCVLSANKVDFGLFYFINFLRFTPPPQGEIQGLASNVAPPNLPVVGKALRPVCHLALDESDYLISGRRPPNRPLPSGATVDAATTRVIEFESCGVRVRTTRRFALVNPTNTPYSFIWEELDDGSLSSETSAFRCLSRWEGCLLEGGEGGNSFFLFGCLFFNLIFN